MPASVCQAETNQKPKPDRQRVCNNIHALHITHIDTAACSTVLDAAKQKKKYV